MFGGGHGRHHPAWPDMAPRFIIIVMLLVVLEHLFARPAACALNSDRDTAQFLTFGPELCDVTYTCEDCGTSTTRIIKIEK